MTRFIYCLTNNGIPTYIGKTNNLNRRINEHKSKYPNEILEVIDEVPTNDWKFWERHYISLFRSWGFNLRNTKLYAGNGSDIVSKETRIKLSITSKGNKNALGNKLTKEQRNKISKSLIGNKRGLGYKPTEEALINLSKSLKGKSWSEKRKLAGGKSHPISEEQKKNHSLKMKGKPWSEKRRLAQSLKNK